MQIGVFFNKKKLKKVKTKPIGLFLCCEKPPVQNQLFNAGHSFITKISVFNSLPKQNRTKKLKRVSCLAKIISIING